MRSAFGVCSSLYFGLETLIWPLPLSVMVRSEWFSHGFWLDPTYLAILCSLRQFGALSGDVFCHLWLYILAVGVFRPLFGGENRGWVTPLCPCFVAILPIL